MISSERFFEGIIDQLVKEGSLLLPDFALFESAYKAAEVDPIAGIIHPPSTAITLNRTIDRNPKSLQAVAKSMNVPFLLLEKFTRTLTEEWKEKLENKEIIDIDGLGRMYIEYDGSLKFNQTIQNQKFNLGNLPELHFKPLVREFSGARSAVATAASRPLYRSKAKVRKGKNLFSRPEFIPVILGVGCFLLILGFYFLIPKQPNFAEQSLSNKVKAERINLNQKPSHQLNLSLAKDTFTDKNLEDRQLQAEVETVFEPEESNSAQVDVDVQPKREVVKPLANQAIIITGAYKNYEGAKRKINKIIDLGFNPFQDQKGDLHRVGVIFPYSHPEEVDKMLADIQANLSPSAWLMN